MTSFPLLHTPLPVRYTIPTQYVPYMEGFSEVQHRLIQCVWCGGRMDLHEEIASHCQLVRTASQGLGWGSYLAKLTFLSSDFQYISGTSLGWGRF